MILVAFVAAMALTLPASASTAHRDPMHYHGGTSSITKTVNGQNCTSHWKWQVNSSGFDGKDYAKVKWTSNPCGFYIQDKIECTGIYENHYYEYSGVVKKTGLWDQATCVALVDSIDNAWRHFQEYGSWTKYYRFWH